MFREYRRRMLAPQEMIQIVESHHVGAGSKPQSSARAASALAAEPLQSFILLGQSFTV